MCCSLKISATSSWLVGAMQVMVITGVGEQAADRLAHLVYFDADIPHDGQSRFDLETPGERTGWEEKASDGMHALLIIEDAAARDVIPDEVKRQWILARLSGQRQPLKTVTEPVHITHPAALALPWTYISGTVGLAGLYAPMAEYARTTPDWKYREVAGTHFAPFTHPQEVANLLLEAAG